MNRHKLVGILEVVSRAIERNNIIPLYEFFCFTGETVFAFNDSFGIVAPCQVPAPFAVHGPTFLGWLKATKEEKVELEVNGSQLKVTVGKSECDIPVKDARDFVWKEPVFKALQIESDVIKGIECCIPTASDNLALEGFSRIYIGNCGDKLAVYSTDGDAFTRYITTIDGSADVCLSKPFCEAVVKTGGGNLIIGDEWVYSLFEDFKVYGRNLGPSTVDYEDYIRKIVEGPIPELVPFPLKFEDALTRARVVADIETSPTKLIVEKNELAFLTETPFGETFDTMKVKHQDVEALVSAALLKESMAGCKEFVVLSKCCVFKGDQLLRLTSNL